jgi:hypothetical protein
VEVATPWPALSTWGRTHKTLTRSLQRAIYSGFVVIVVALIVLIVLVVLALLMLAGTFRWSR